MYIPQEFKDKYNRMKAQKTNRGSKKYWVEAARKRGLRDTENGIMYDPPGSK